jgi:hypothetical protein
MHNRFPVHAAKGRLLCCRGESSFGIRRFRAAPCMSESGVSSAFVSRELGGLRVTQHPRFCYTYRSALKG